MSGNVKLTLKNIHLHVVHGETTLNMKIDKLKVKEWRIFYHANSNQKKF